MCLGMQLMGLSSPEDGYTLGLGFIKSNVDKFTPDEIGSNKLPHTGFDEVHSQTGGYLFKGLKEKTDFYFVHSYRMLPVDLKGILATSFYGVDYLAAYEQDNIYATQFHPEKSHRFGLRLISNFLAAPC